MKKYEKEINYNLKSIKRFGWTPQWFGVLEVDDELVEAIMLFQEEHNLSADGLVGPGTYRRLETSVLAKEKASLKKVRKRRVNQSLIYNRKYVPIKWKKVKLYTEEDGLKIEGKNYYDYSNKPARQPTQFVNHWDATLNSEACARIINKRNLSMHFLIDNDGTIYQLMDMQDGAFQAGNKLSNKIGLGVEISNAYYLKYQKWYTKNGFGKRPIESGHKLNGWKVPDHLGFYDIQLEALAALWEAVHQATGIPLEICLTKGVDKSCQTGEFAGFINHFNLTKNKQDCISLDMEKVLEKAIALKEQPY